VTLPFWLALPFATLPFWVALPFSAALPSCPALALSAGSVILAPQLTPDACYIQTNRERVASGSTPMAGLAAFRVRLNGAGMRR
jgi:hypothetical protein